ncbi:MAG: hypothetical protein JWO82_4269 [Akkermansiaceae bacterium]|nr:hypothetical protein [Akkermansiaceae bacterium]
MDEPEIGWRTAGVVAGKDRGPLRSATIAMEIPGPDDAAPSFPDVFAARLPENPELRHVVRTELEQRMAYAEPGPGDDTPEQGVARLERNPAPKGVSRYGLIAGFALAFLFLLLGGFAEVPAVIMDLDGGSKIPAFLQVRIDAWKKSQVVSEDVYQPLLHPMSDWARDSRAIWEKRPEDRVLYHLASFYECMATQGMPADYDQTWPKLDPDNALWPLEKSSVMIFAALRYDSTTRKQRVIDPAKFAEGIAAFEQASRMPFYNNFSAESGRRTLPTLRTPRNRLEAGFAENCMRWSQTRYRQPYGKGILLQAEALGAAGERDKLADLLAAVRRVALLVCSSDHPRRNGVSVRLFPLEDLAGIAGRQGLPDEERKLWALKKVLESRAATDMVAGLGPGEAEANGDPRHIGSWSPEGQVDLILEMRLRALAAAAFFTVLAVALAVRQLPVRGASGQTTRVLSRLHGQGSGWLLIMVAVVSPVLILAAGVNLLPQDLSRPYGVRSATDALAILSGFGLFIGLLVTLHIARVQLYRRTAFLGLRPRRLQMVLGSIALGLGLAGTATILLYLHSEYFAAAVFADMTIIYAAIPLLWLIVKFIVGLFRHDATLRHRLLARRLTAPMLGMAFLLIGVVGICYGLERHIVASDPQHLVRATVGPPSPEFKVQLDKLREEWK